MEPDLSEIIPKVHLEPIEVPPCERPGPEEERARARRRKNIEKNFKVDLDDAAKANEILSKHQN